MSQRAEERRPIRRLSRATVERIAAGEVVERPASVVKELIENAYDAGATAVSLRISGGGLSRIEVADDGWGIPAEELGLAVERHATSKLTPEGPFDAIETLGFRGEALAAIASVSRLKLLSRPRDAELAEGIAVSGEASPERFAAARSVGTTVEVEELFFNTPARRKFLRSAVREQADVVRTVEELYLARPQVSLRLSGDTTELVSLPAASLRVAADRVLGPAFAASSFPLRVRNGAVQFDGFLGLPAVAGPASTGLYLSVNGRPVVARALTQAVRLGYGETIPRTRFPVGVVHLQVDPSTVDVNVHPTKREVRFAAARELEDRLRRAVREALNVAPLSSEPRGVFVPPSGPGERRLRSSASTLLPRPPLPRPSQRTIDEPEARAPSAAFPAAGGDPPRLELLGAVDALYWVATAGDGIVLIDQHAASERLLYAAVLDGGSVARQTLVEPVALSLTAGQRSQLEAHAEEVRAAGFQVEAFGPGTYRVVRVPTFRGRTVHAEAVVELLRELSDGGRATVPDGIAERRAASIACHAAIRAGDAVERSTLVEILRALDRLPDRPRSCPHGRPIRVELPRSRLDRWFLRSGA